jgi:hypothetical protein
LTDIAEAGLGTNPELRDTDGDGIEDSDEITLGLSPVIPDAHTLVASIPGLRLHLAADHGLELDDADGISAWHDRSAYESVALQDDAEHRPHVGHPTGSQLPVVVFDGVDDHLRLSDIMAGAAEGEIFVVGRLDETAGGYHAVVQFGQGYGTSYGPDQGNDFWEDFGLSDADPHAAPADFGALLRRLHLYQSRVTASGLSVTGFNNIVHLRRVDRQVAFSASPLIGTNVVGEFFKGEIAEIIVFDRPLAPVERARLFAYLGARHRGAADAATEIADKYRLPELVDHDFDDVSDVEELRRGTDPSAYFSSASAPKLRFIAGQGQSPTPGQYLPEPIILRATDNNDVPWPFAPVTIDVVGGDGRIATNPQDTNPVSILTLRTDADGLVRVYWKMP